MVAPAPSPTDDELARLNLFRSVDVETVRSHLRRCSVSSFAARDEILIHADQPNDRIYLLLSGALSIHLGSPDDPPIVVLGAGETIGELSLIDKQPTSAFVVAQTACRVLVVDESVMWDLVQCSHTIALNLFNTLSHRLRYDNRLIYQDREQLRAPCSGARGRAGGAAAQRAALPGAVRPEPDDVHHRGLPGPGALGQSARRRGARLCGCGARRTADLAPLSAG